MKTIDENTLNEIRNLITNQRKSQTEVCKLLNISKPTLRKIIKENGWDSCDVLLTDKEKQDITTMYCDNGYVVRVISEKLKISEKQIKEYIQLHQLKKKEKTKTNNEELELNKLDALERIQDELIERHKNDPFALKMINESDLELLIKAARKYAAEADDMFVMEGDDKSMCVKRKQVNKMTDSHKVSKYIIYRKDLVYDIVCEKIYAILKPHINQTYINIPKPVFNGEVAAVIDECGVETRCWREKFELDMFGDEFSKIIKLINESIDNDTNFILDMYLKNNHNELFKKKNLHGVEYDIVDTRLLKDDIAGLCVIYDLFKDYNIVEDELELSEDEKILFDAHSKFESIIINDNGKARQMKNYDKLEIYKAIEGNYMDDLTRGAYVQSVEYKNIYKKKRFS